MRKSEDKQFVLRVATLYYAKGLTQAEIARKMGISRPLVSQILQDAKSRGIVEIYIKDEDAHTVSLEIELTEKYGLEEVIVVPNRRSATEAIAKKNVGRAGASYLTRVLPKVKRVGLSWGTTLAEFVDEMPYLQYPHVRVVPIMGGVSYSDVLYHSNHLSFLLAQKLAATSTYFYAPALADTYELKQNLLASSMIKQALQEGRGVDVAIVGIGNPIHSSTYRELGYFDNEDMKDLEEQGAVGDIVATFFDQEGTAVNTPLSRRMMGIELADLARIPCVMALATGEEKVESIRALLQKQVLDVLVIDQRIAERL